MLVSTPQNAHVETWSPVRWSLEVGPLGHDGGALTNRISGLTGAEETQVPYFYHARTQREDRCLGTRRWALATNQTASTLILNVPSSTTLTNSSLLFISPSVYGIVPANQKGEDAGIRGIAPTGCELMSLTGFVSTSIWNSTTKTCSTGSIYTKLGNHHHPTVGGFSAAASAPFSLLSLVLKTKSPGRFQNVILKFKAE